MKRTDMQEGLLERLTTKQNFWHNFFYLIVKRHGIRKIEILFDNTRLAFWMYRAIRGCGAGIKLSPSGVIGRRGNGIMRPSDWLLINISRDQNIKSDALFTLQDLEQIGGWGQIEQADIPRVFNTLENCYSRIYIIGKDRFARKIYDYLKSNPYIQVHHIKKEALANFINENSDGIILQMDFAVRFKPKAGNQYVYTLKDYYMANGLSKDIDIWQNIVPTLLKKGIQVIGLYQDIDKLSSYRRILDRKKYSSEEEHMAMIYSTLEKTSGEAFVRELKNVKSDMHKGYVTCYFNGTYINYITGRRHVPREVYIGYKPRIFIAGPCLAVGTHQNDYEMIAAALQRKVEGHYQVEIVGGGYRNLNFALRELNMEHGDLLLLIDGEATIRKHMRRYEIKIPLFNYKEAYRNVSSDHFLDDNLFHVDGTITKAIGEKTYEYLAGAGLLKNHPIVGERPIYKQAEKKPSVRMLDDKKLISYLQNLKKKYRRPGKNGAIVMNANPFTLGHRYLVETAKRNVDNLYVFVLEEDRSYFSFEERLALVRAGVRDMENVTVIPGGKYVISTQTLPGYFTKEQEQDILIDAGNDLDMFVYIADALNIAIRYVGEEPIDKITRQYNEQMKDYLNKYKIDVREIPRLETGGNVISASYVRRLYTEDNEEKWEKIKSLVPPTTYEYLREIN